MSIDEELELFSISGLDDAIIGTTVRDGVEVIAYDFDKAVEIIVKRGFTRDHAHDWLGDVADRQFEGAPAFIYAGSPEGFYSFDADSGTTIH